MPDISLFKPLCEILDITLNDLMSGEKVSTSEYQEKLEENIENTIEYTNQKITNQRNILSLIIICTGIFIIFTSMTIFPSESSWGGLYSIIGIIVSMIGLNMLIEIEKIKWSKITFINIGYLLLSLITVYIIDYIGVVNIGQAPRFSITKISADTEIYYDTLFYDVIKCNINQKDEKYVIIKNQKYDMDKNYCE